eukprot:Em0017g497a
MYCGCTNTYVWYALLHLFRGSKWCQWEGLFWQLLYMAAPMGRKVERKLLDVSVLPSLKWKRVILIFTLLIFAYVFITTCTTLDLQCT